MEDPYTSAYSLVDGHSPDPYVGQVGFTGYTRAEQVSANEAWNDWRRNETSAQVARDWSEYMSNTAVQRSVADYTAAGFSPLAAIQGGGASTPTASVGSGAAASGSNDSTFNALVRALGTIVAKSITSAIAAAA